MAWYHDEANKQNAIEQENLNKQRIIQQSNLWANLRRQIEQDVAGINETDFWNKRLAGLPLTVSNELGGDGYGIHKPGYPAVMIILRHKGDHVELDREFAEYELETQYEMTEQLSIGSDGKQVYLQTQDNKRLAVPEEASKYILMPIIDSLKLRKPIP